MWTVTARTPVLRLSGPVEAGAIRRGGITIVCMAMDRLSVTMDPELGRAVREAAARDGVSVSHWLSEAAGDKLRNVLLGVALDAWEEQDGPFTEDELNEAARALGIDRRARQAG